MADKIVDMAEAHRVRQQLQAPGPAKSSQTKQETSERRPGLSSSDLTAGRWDPNHQHIRAGGSGTPGPSSGKRRYSGGNKSAKRKF